MGRWPALTLLCMVGAMAGCSGKSEQSEASDPAISEAASVEAEASQQPTDTVPSRSADEMKAALASADAGHGKTVFEQHCTVCHSLSEGTGAHFGPVLTGVVGAKSGSKPNFVYSPALADGKLLWTPVALDAFIAKPQKAAPGTHMTFPGLPDVRDRSDLIKYLLQQGSSHE